MYVTALRLIPWNTVLVVGAAAALMMYLGVDLVGLAADLLGIDSALFDWL